MAKRHKSALKRNRQNIKRRERNKAIRSNARTAVRGLRETIAKQDAPAAETELRTVVKTLTKAGTKGVLHRNTVSRRIARLSKQVAALREKQPAVGSGQ